QELPRRATAAPLTYHEKRELARMEDVILAAEAELSALDAELHQANQSADHGRLQRAFEQREAAADRVDQLYARWEMLASRAEG
ncbi:MAG TPA: hypothetical protein ENN96_01560, partial [Candidatus Acetothermia bacterium]|nr:hypothetical protein [Candidatus Acetothermia bacterium]